MTALLGEATVKSKEVTSPLGWRRAGRPRSSARRRGTAAATLPADSPPDAASRCSPSPLLLARRNLFSAFVQTT